VTVAAIVAAIGIARRDTAPASSAAVVQRGGEIVASTRSDPRSFNKIVNPSDQTTDLISSLTQARLVRVNRVSDEVEPWLAERWSRADDGLRYTFTLRPDVAFSDGHAFTSDDVVFSFQATYEAKSALADALQVNGKPIQVTAPDARTVIVTFPSAFAPALRLIDLVPILPRHKLDAALKAGTFAGAWGASAAPSDIVGLGPFVLAQYTRGDRLVFTRNPHYWRKDTNGASLPYLDRITVLITPDQDTQLLQLDSGQIDLTANEVRPEDYAPLKRAAAAGRIKLLDLGPAYDADSFWINLKPGAFTADPRAAWLQRDELRQAISLAVDRQKFADTVFLGAGVPVFGPVTPANRKWFWADQPKTPYDRTRALALLAAIGLTPHRGPDGMDVLVDAQQRPARFTLLTQKGRSSVERGAAVIRDELKQIGLAVDVVTLDYGGVVQRFLSGNYDAVFLNVYGTDTDPAINADFWLSSGSSHIWNIAEKTPATAWERQIDELITKQTAASADRERKLLFDEVQKIFAEHQPVVYFAAPRVYVAASARLTNLTPAIPRPQLLWSSDTLAATSSVRATH